MKRFIVEIGMGCDLHGGDVTKATAKAIKDAMSHSCLCGLAESVPVSRAEIHVKIACPHPEKLDLSHLTELFPFGNIKFTEIVEGGLETVGLHVPELGEGNRIVVSLVSLTVCFE